MFDETPVINLSASRDVFHHPSSIVACIFATSNLQHSYSGYHEDTALLQRECTYRAYTATAATAP
jgi:hypothetical protein